jgi:hypothetical protein
MGGLIQPSPVAQEHESNWRPILLGVVLVVVVVGLLAWFSRGQPKGAAATHPYAANVKLSDLKQPTAVENFVGVSVTYLEGTVTNSGDKIVTRATVHVVFKDSMGQLVQVEDAPLRVLQTTPYLDAVDLTTAPLAPGQSKPFRLTFEHVSNEWNRDYPEMQVTDVSVK